MNYRHAFHAGNFADLAKHAAILLILQQLRLKDEAFLAVDTHAGAGYYDLTDETFARSKEAEAGIKYLMGGNVPTSLKPLADYVRVKNRAMGFKETIGLYPGSPQLIIDHLRAGDDYHGYELRDDDFHLLRKRIMPRGLTRQVDGYEAGLAAFEDPKSLFYLIDPPFERFDDYERVISLCAQIFTHRADSTVLIWVPLKDLETFDRFLRLLERDMPKDRPEITVCELRLRPLTAPMKLNGCALLALGTPESFFADLALVAKDIIRLFGQDGAKEKLGVL